MTCIPVVTLALSGSQLALHQHSKPNHCRAVGWGVWNERSKWRSYVTVPSLSTHFLISSVPKARRELNGY